MPELILHVGYGKTGTTYLQTALHRNREALNACGVLYPDMRNGLSKHAPVVPFLAGHEETKPYHAGWAEQNAVTESPLHWQFVLDQMARHDPRRVILCDESLIHCDAEADRIAEILAPHFDDIRVVIYLDSPQKAFLKLAQQRLKSRGLPPRLNLPRYRAQISGFAGQPAFRLGLHVYDRAHFPGGDVLAHFCRQYCPEWAEIDAELPAGDLNRGLSAEAMAVAEQQGRALAETDLTERSKRWTGIREALTEADREVPGYCRPRLTDHMADYIQRAHPDLEWLRNTHGVAFADVDYDIASAGVPEDVPNLCVRDLCDVDPTRAGEIARVVLQAGFPTDS